MIIHEPEISSSNGEIVVSARIESAQGIPNLPKELWFAFPERFESWICDRSDAFLTALIKPAMVLNEPLEVRGIVSPLLAYNIYEYQRIYNSWFPKVLKLIEIEFHDNSLSEIVAQNAVSSCFSGVYRDRRGVQPQSVSATHRSANRSPLSALCILSGSCWVLFLLLTAHIIFNIRNLQIQF